MFFQILFWNIFFVYSNVGLIWTFSCRAFQYVSADFFRLKLFFIFDDLSTFFLAISQFEKNFFPVQGNTNCQGSFLNFEKKSFCPHELKKQTCQQSGNSQNFLCKFIILFVILRCLYGVVIHRKSVWFLQ